MPKRFSRALLLLLAVLMSGCTASLPNLTDVKASLSSTARTPTPQSSWAHVMASGEITSVTQSQSDVKQLYACGQLQTGGGNAAWHSTDTGHNWQQIQLPQGISSGDCEIAINSSNANDIYFTIHSQSLLNMYHSTDSGAHWSGTLLPDGSLGDIHVIVNSSGIDALIHQPASSQPDLIRLMRSTDGGSSWNDIDQPLLDNGVIILNFVADPDKTGGIYVFTRLNPARAYTNPIQRGGVWYTSDNGKTWNQISNELPPSGQILSPEDNGKLFVIDLSTPILNMSSDAGSHWMRLPIPTAQNQSDILLNNAKFVGSPVPFGETLYSAIQSAGSNSTSSGTQIVSLSTDDSSWQPMQGAPATQQGELFSTGNILWIAEQSGNGGLYRFGPN